MQNINQKCKTDCGIEPSINENKDTKITSQNKVYSKANEKYYVANIDTYFNSLDSYEKYLFGTASRDNYQSFWQELGFDYPTQKSFKNDHNTKKKLAIYGNGYALGSDKGNAIDYLNKYENKNTISFLASVYNLDYEIVNVAKFLKVDEQENDTYFENLCKEFELGSDNPYFKKSDNGFIINYLDLLKNSFPYNQGVFERQRLFKFSKNKYHTPQKLDNNQRGYFAYLTPLAFHKQILEFSTTLYAVEGEKKALFGVKMLKRAFVGVAGVGLGTTTAKNILTKKSVPASANFLPETLQLLENNPQIKLYRLVFDSDTFENLNKKSRAASFFASIRKEFYAAQANKLKFIFTCINPNTGCKGLDDLKAKYSIEEINHCLDSTTHNDLFWHFKIENKRQLDKLKDAFFGSSEVKKRPKQIKIVGKIGNQLLEDANSEFVTSFIKNRNVGIIGGTGIGKSYFIENSLVPFAKIAFGAKTKILFCSPYNALAKQQSNKNILFTGATNEEAIQRTDAEINDTDIFYCNENNLNTAYKTLKLHVENVIIVVDECHKLITDSKFRREPIREVHDVLNRNFKNLFLTATPLDLHLDDYSEFEVISTNRAESNPADLIFCTKDNQLECTSREILKAIREKRRVIVHYNNLDHLQALKALLSEKKIKSRICANNTEPQDTEYFRKIQGSKDFIWNDEIDIILTTSITELGINILTNRNVQTIFVNQNTLQFDNVGYRQFIGRIRNNTEFDVKHLIIMQNFKFNLPCTSLKKSFDYEFEKEILTNRALSATSEYNLIKRKFGKVEKERVNDVLKVYVGTLFNSDTKEYEMDRAYLDSKYYEHKQRNNSVFFEKINSISHYEQVEENELLQSKLDEQIELKEKSEKHVFELYTNDFYTLIASVNEQTKDVKLQSKTFLRENTAEPIQLNNKELQFSENLLKNHFLLSKSVKTESTLDLECSSIKNILINKETQTIRKSNNLALEKKKYAFYFLLTDNETTLRVREQKQKKELERICSVFQNSIDKELTAQELLKLLNKGRPNNFAYKKSELIDFIEILTEFEVDKKQVNGKRAYYYAIKNLLDFKASFENLTS